MGQFNDFIGINIYLKNKYGIFDLPYFWWGDYLTPIQQVPGWWIGEYPTDM